MASIDIFLVARAGAALRRLKKAGLSLVTAESCTAGLLAAALSHCEGAGECLEGGFVTYTKVQKARALNVSRKLLASEGSVTARIAEAMARGALRHSSADIALAVTGVLGPSCDEDGNPVGLVFLCCLRRGHNPLTIEKGYGRKAHDRLRRQTVIDAFELLQGSIPRSRRTL